MIDKNLVSVIIPTYNRANLLPRAIQSVLQQSYDDIELIVVDDGSDDNTNSVMKDYQDDCIEYIRLPKNMGGSHARNKGIRQATGDYMAFLDDDDEWHSTKIEKQLSHLQNLNEEWIGVYCDVFLNRNSLLKKLFDLINVTEGGGYEDDTDIQAGLLTMTALVHGGSTLLIEKDAVNNISGFDEDFAHRQDIEFLIRLTEYGKLSYLDEKLVTLHDTNRPNPESVLEAQQLLMSKFDYKVKELESKGYDIYGVHNLYLTQQYLRQGELKTAIRLIPKARPKNIRHVIGLLYDFYQYLLVTLSPK